MSAPIFETRTATGREHFASQGSGVSQIFVLIISNGEKKLGNEMWLCEDKLKGKTAHFRLPSACQKRACLSMRIFETRTATGSQPFPLLTCRHTTTFILLSIFSPLEMISIKIWETPLSWHAKCSLPVAVRVLKTRVPQGSVLSPILWGYYKEARHGISFSCE